MKFFELVKFSFSSLWRRKLRTVLTLLGVMIGTASIVVMMSLGIGIDYSYTEQLKNSATLTLINVYNYNTGSTGSTDTKLTQDTVDTFAAMAHVTCASPVYQFDVVAQSGKYQGNLSVMAVTHDMLEAMKLPVLRGSLPAEGDPLQLIAGRQAGNNFYDPSANANSDGGMMYFSTDGATEPPVDMYESQIFAIYDTSAYYNQKPFKKYLLTTCAEVGSADANGYSEYDYGVYADLAAVETQFQKIFKKNAWPNQTTDKSGKPVRPMTYSQAYVLVDDIKNVTDVQNQITAMGFQASSNADYLKSMQESSRMIQYLLAGIGSVSLIVAAIGITNTMLMSIFERTKEIGIFKVLGCSLGNIRAMFLTEAGLIGFSGGMLGLALSFLLSKIINLLIGQSTAVSVIPAWLALLGLGFAVGVGMVAGISPAIRATKLSPLEAIRTL